MSEQIEHSPEEQDARGRAILRLLGVRLKANGRVDTPIGDKTPTGIYQTVKRILEQPDIAEKFEELFD